MIVATKAFSGFSVRDIGEMKTFYEDVLELPVRESQGMLSIDLGAGHHVLVYPKGPAHGPLIAWFTDPSENIMSVIADE